MKYRELGRTGWKVSEISFGCWAIGSQWGDVDDKESLAALHRAIDLPFIFLPVAKQASVGGLHEYGTRCSYAQVQSQQQEQTKVGQRRPPGTGTPAQQDEYQVQVDVPVIDQADPHAALVQRRLDAGEDL